jgi:hypothetical protein
LPCLGVRARLERDKEICTSIHSRSSANAQLGLFWQLFEATAVGVRERFLMQAALMRVCEVHFAPIRCAPVPRLCLKTAVAPARARRKRPRLCGKTRTAHVHKEEKRRRIPVRLNATLPAATGPRNLVLKQTETKRGYKAVIKRRQRGCP